MASSVNVCVFCLYKRCTCEVKNRSHMASGRVFAATARKRKRSIDEVDEDEPARRRRAVPGLESEDEEEDDEPPPRRRAVPGLESEEEDGDEPGPSTAQEEKPGPSAPAAQRRQRIQREPLPP